MDELDQIYDIYQTINWYFGSKAAGEWLEMFWERKTREEALGPNQISKLFKQEGGGGEPDNAGDSSLDQFLDSSGEGVDRRLILLSGSDIDEASMGFIPHQACEAVAAELNNILIERANQ